MSKVQFLRNQYVEMLASGQPVCERWKAGFEFFMEDLLHSTPSSPGRRYLGVKAAELGYAPGNVEWHFHSTVKGKPRRREQERAESAARAEERRKMIAEQYRRWEERNALRGK
jgi:hypothetical protein